MASLPTDLTVIPRALIVADIQENIRSAASSTARTKDFNTAEHSHATIAARLPHMPHREPDSLTSDFGTWLPLIARSRGITGRCLEIEIPAFLGRVIIDAVRVFDARGRAAVQLVEEVVDLFPSKTTSGIPLPKLMSGRGS